MAMSNTNATFCEASATAATGSMATQALQPPSTFELLVNVTDSIESKNGNDKIAVNKEINNDIDDNMEAYYCAIKEILNRGIMRIDAFMDSAEPTCLDLRSGNDNQLDDDHDCEPENSISLLRDELDAVDCCFAYYVHNITIPNRKTDDTMGTMKLKTNHFISHHGGATTTNVIGSYFKDCDKVNFQPLPDPLRALRTIDILIEQDKSNKRYEASCASLHVSVQPESVWLDYYSDPQNMMSKDSSSYANNCPGYYDGAHSMHRGLPPMEADFMPVDQPPPSLVKTPSPHKLQPLLPKIQPTPIKLPPTDIHVPQAGTNDNLSQRPNLLESQSNDDREQNVVPTRGKTPHTENIESYVVDRGGRLEVTASDAVKHVLAGFSGDAKAAVQKAFDESVHPCDATTDLADKDSSLRIIRWIDILIKRDKIFFGTTTVLYFYSTVQALLCTVPVHLLVLHAHFTFSLLFSFSTPYLYLPLAHRVQ
jgi:hypothetical protein